MNDEDIEITIEHEVQHDITPPPPVIYRDCGACGKIIRKWPTKCIFCEEWLHNHGCGFLCSKKGNEPGLTVGGICCPLCFKEHQHEFVDTSFQYAKRLKL